MFEPSDYVLEKDDDKINLVDSVVFLLAVLIAGYSLCTILVTTLEDCNFYPFIYQETINTITIQ